MSDSIPQKQCSKCKQFKPATLEFFSGEKRVLDGLTRQCRACRNKGLNERYKNDPEYREYLERKKVERRNDPVKSQHDKERERKRSQRPEQKTRTNELARLRRTNPGYRQKEYDRKNKRRRERYAEDPEYREHVLEQCKASETKPERRVKIRLYKRERYHNNPEHRRRHKAGIERYNQTDRGKNAHRVTSSKRRAKKRNAEGFYTNDDIEVQYRSQSGKCWHCGKQLKGKYEVDHLIPLDKGGTNWPNNIVCACRKCNRSKGAKLTIEWNGKLF